MIDTQSKSNAPTAPSARWGRALLLLVAIFGFVFAPVPLCPTRQWLHLPCPGCGATRAVLLAVRGDFGASFRMHPLAIPAAILAVPTLFFLLRDAMREEAQPIPRPLRWVWGVFVAALFAVWIARFFGAFGGPAPI